MNQIKCIMVLSVNKNFLLKIFHVKIIKRQCHTHASDLENLWPLIFYALTVFLCFLNCIEQNVLYREKHTFNRPSKYILA